MQAHAVLRLTLADIKSDNRASFWRSYWNLADEASGVPVRERSPEESEARLRDEFGRALKVFISLRDVDSARSRVFERTAGLEIHVRGISYGSIEILLAIIGGEELITEMFWSVLEFNAPMAFNSAMDAPRDIPMQAELVRTGRPEKSGKLERLLTVGQTPLVAWVVLLIGVIYFGYLYLEKVEKENDRLNANYNSLVLRVIDQNIATANSLISKLAPPQQLPPPVAVNSSTPPPATPAAAVATPTPTLASTPTLATPAAPVATPTPTPTKTPP